MLSRRLASVARAVSRRALRLPVRASAALVSLQRVVTLKPTGVTVRALSQTATFPTANPQAFTARRNSRTMTTTASTNKDIADFVKADHAVVTNLFDCYKKASNDTDKQHCMWKVIRELSIHGTVEEEIMYPFLKNKLGAEGLKWYDRSVNEHLELKKALYELDQIDADPKNPKCAGIMTTVEKLTNAHVKEEENELFPFMAKSCDKETLIHLGKQYCDYKPYMPTRPHPDAPVGSTIGDRALAVADYLRDAKRFAGVKDYAVHDPSKLPAMQQQQQVPTMKGTGTQMHC